MSSTACSRSATERGARRAAEDALDEEMEKGTSMTEALGRQAGLAWSAEPDTILVPLLLKPTDKILLL